MMPTPRPNKTPGMPVGELVTVSALSGIVLLVPFAIWPGVYKYALLPKWLVLHLGVAMACLGWGIQSRWEGRPAWTPTPMDLPVLFWMGAGLLAALGSTHLLDTSAELLDRASLAILLLMAANALSLDRLRPIFWASAMAGLGVGAVGILQYHGLFWMDIPSKAPPAVTFANRNLAADYLVCAIPLSALLFVTVRVRWAQVLSGLSATLMGVYLVYVRARGAWVGVVGAILCVAAVSLGWPGMRGGVEALGRALREPPRQRWTVGFLALFLVLALLPPYHPGLPQSKADVATTAASVFQKETLDEDAGIRDRLVFWANTLRMIADHPILGVGAGGWARAYPPYDRGATLRTNTVLNSPHNDYLWVAAEEGIVGLVSYLWVLSAGLTCLGTLALRREGSLGLSALLFAIAVLSVLGDALFGFPRSQPQAMLFLCLVFGLAAGAAIRNREEMSEPRKRPRASPIPLVPGLCLVIALAAATVSWRRIGFDRHYVNALERGAARDWPSLLSEVEAALQYGTFRPQILQVRSVALLNQGRYAEGEQDCRLALGYTPYDWRLHAGLGAVLMREGRLSEALAHVQTALDLCPRATFLRRNLFEIHRGTGNLDRAGEALRAMLRDAPRDAWATLELGNLAFGQGDLAGALGAYRSYLGLDTGDAAGVRLARERIARLEERMRR